MLQLLHLPISAEDVSAQFPQASNHAERLASSVDRHQSLSRQFLYRVAKRMLDIAIVVAALPLLVPVLLLIGCLVRITSPGSIFFSHRRIGENGQFFSMWKFRTMCANSTEALEEYLVRNPEAQAEWSRSHKLTFDPRITSVGLFLRQYSLDELPQLLNVISGRMSLVGPRPIVAAEVEKYKDSFTFYCQVKPGMTGLWQISGRSKLSYDQRVGLDREYVQRWSLTRDLIILLKTVSSVVNKEGAV